MLIEHTFVTTLSSNQALASAAELLALGGFATNFEPAFALDGAGWTSLEMRRGRKSAARAKDATQCPQSVRLEWDRGRVNAAAAIEPSHRNRSFFSSGIYNVVIFQTSRSARKDAEYSDLMIAICRALELRLVAGVPPEQAVGEWFAREMEIREIARKRRIRSWIYAGILLAVIVGLIVVAAISATRFHTNSAPIYRAPSYPYRSPRGPQRFVPPRPYYPRGY